MSEGNIEKFPSESTRLPEPDLKALEKDLAALGAFELPEDPNQLAEESKGWGIDPQNIMWWRGLTKEEQELVKSDEPWNLDEKNRPKPLGDLFVS